MSGGGGNSIFDASVTVHLIDKVSAGLAQIARSCVKTTAATAALQKQMHAIHSTFNRGLVMVGAGAALAAPLVAATKEAEKYQHQLNMMRSAGLSNKQVAESIGAAWKTTGSVITSTATENLKVIMDLRSVFGETKSGSMAEAIEYMPKFAKIQGAYASVLDGKLSGHADELTFAMAKALDMIGKVKNAQEFNKGSEAMFRVTEATGGRVTPADYQAVFKYARQGKYGMSDDFMYKVLPELMLENKTGHSGGASGVGTQLQALYRFGVQGIMTVRAAQNLAKMGLVEMHQVLKTTTTGTTLGERKKGEMTHGGVFRSELLAQNPLQWVQDVYIPKLAAANHLKVTDTDKLVQASNQVFKGNALATSLVGELIKKQQQYTRFPSMFNKTDSIDKAYDRGQKNDPAANWKDLAAAFENVKTAIGEQILPTLIPMVNQLAQALQNAGKYMHDHPGMTKAMAGTIAFASGLLILGGAINIVSAGFLGLKLLIGPVGLWLLRVGANFAAIRAPLMIIFGVLSKFWLPLAILTTAITLIVVVVQNWGNIMKFVKSAVDIAVRSIWSMVPALAAIVSNIAGFVGMIPMMGGLAANMKALSAGMTAADTIHKAQEAAGKVAQPPGKQTSPQTIQNMKDVMARSHKPQNVMQTNHFNVVMPEGHDHKKCVQEIGKSMAGKAAHVASSKGGPSGVARSRIAFGAGQ